MLKYRCTKWFCNPVRTLTSEHLQRPKYIFGFWIRKEEMQQKDKNHLLNNTQLWCFHNNIQCLLAMYLNKQQFSKMKKKNDAKSQNKHQGRVKRLNSSNLETIRIIIITTSTVRWNYTTKQAKNSTDIECLMLSSEEQVLSQFDRIVVVLKKYFNTKKRKI